MKFYICLFYSLISFYGALASANLSCQSLLDSHHFPPHQGRRLEQIEHATSHLGAGVRAFVVRMQMHSQTFNLKRYKKAHIPFLSLDLLNFKFLDTVPTEDLNIRTVQTIRGEQERDLWVEDVQGQNLQDILLGPTDLYSLELKTKLFMRYYEYLKRVENVLGKTPDAKIKKWAPKGLSIVMMPIPVLTIESAENWTAVFIKPDNFIVNSRTLEIVNIDPN